VDQACQWFEEIALPDFLVVRFLLQMLWQIVVLLLQLVE